MENVRRDRKRGENVCSVPRTEPDPVNAGQRNQGSRVGRRGRICELTRGEKWENWSSSPLCILSTFVAIVIEQDRKKARKREKDSVCVYVSVIVFIH